MNPNRPAMLRDLTRWNRAGLSRFAYVDGDAATWLDELRLALMGLYARGADPALRVPEFWRGLTLRPEADWPAPADVQAVADRVAWKALAPTMPPRPETVARRTQRLLDAYGAPPGDYALEILRTLARAADILLRYQNAYANEGYLRTATQWDNLRRLAAMVNYQPTPPSSASTTIALVLASDAGAVTVPRALGFKVQPSDGGTPLVFETLSEVAGHPALNGARAVGWNENRVPADPTGLAWAAPTDAALAPGDLAVLDTAVRISPCRIAAVTRDAEAGTAMLTLDIASPAPVSTEPFTTRLWTEPASVQRGLGTSASGAWVITLPPSAPAIVAGAVVLVDGTPLAVAEASGRSFTVRSTAQFGGAVSVVALSPFAVAGSGAIAPDGIETVGGQKLMYFVTPSGVREVAGLPLEDEDGKSIGGWRFTRPGGGGASGYARPSGTPSFTGTVETGADWIVPASGDRTRRLVRFAGKPAKGLAAGDRFVARAVSGGTLAVLRVVAIRVGPEDHMVQFDVDSPAAPERTEFHGPLRRSLAPQDHDVSPDPAASGGSTTLTGLPPEAVALLRPGRALIVEGEGRSASATLTAVATDESGCTITFSPPEAADGCSAGRTLFRLNTVVVGHGETRGARTLGSGDGEKTGQRFALPVKAVSHVASAIAESGVVPDIDVTVAGERWDYRDLIDPSAEGEKAWSSTLQDDGTLLIAFRRRLPTGIDNVVVTRHRVGVGLAGTGVAPFAMAKPARKHRHVVAAVQPFVTAGGADREPVASLRTAAPARLAANGRAVTLKDFAGLAGRHAQVWRARAEEVPAPGAARVVRLVLVPAGGGAVTDTLRADLAAAFAARTLPGVRLVFDGHVALPVVMEATVRADLTAVDATDLKRAAEDALALAFALQGRAFGQPVYIAEILAALERVPGVVTAVVTRFERAAGAPSPLNEAVIDGRIAAIFPTRDQVAHVATATDVAVTVENLA